MSEYEQVELYPSVKPNSPSEHGHFVAEYDDWKYTFQIQKQVILLVSVTRPWEVGDPSPPDWVPAAADERVTVKRQSRADIPPAVITALLAKGLLGTQYRLRVRPGE